MIVDIGDLTDEASEDLITNAFVQELDIHPSDIDVSYDSETGVVTYTITSDDAESLDTMIHDMQEEGFESGLAVTDGISIDDYVPPSEITATVDVTVDASNVEDADAAVTSVTQAIEEQHTSYDVSGDGNCIKFIT